MSKIRIGGTVAAVALVGLTLAACTSAPVEKSESKASDTTVEETVVDTAGWEDELREGVRFGFTQGTAEDTAMACEGFGMMGIDTPAEIAEFMQTAGEDGALLDAAFDDFGGTEGAEDQLPDGVTMNDVLLVAGEEVVDICRF